jgi:4-amino-4-deoxy-L-arabinose transferase-like glycosyltransferase
MKVKNLRQLWSVYWFFASFFIILLAAILLRFCNLADLPPSLYWEEAALGYDAYSILKTGKDHHGNPWPIAAFTSFGDYKPSGYFYATVPFIALFGLNEWAVRLPSAIAGVFTVVGIGILTRFLSQRLWPDKTKERHQVTQLAAMTAATFSPWLIQFSRGGWEVNLASCFLLWGVLLYFIGLEKKQRKLAWFIGGALLFVLATFTYHATRVIAPLMLVGIGGILLIDWQKRFSRLIPFVMSGFLWLILCSPILLANSQVTGQRFAETSITGDGAYVAESNAIREASGNSPIVRPLSHRYLILAEQVTGNFFSHFQPDFLFVTGDQNLRHSVGWFGLFYPIDALWLSVGLVVLMSSLLQQKKAWPFGLLLLWWLGIGILPASITKAAPHALRILPAAPVFFVILSFGVVTVGEWLLKQKVFKFSIPLPLVIGAMLLVLFGQWGMYWRFYTKIYPALAASEWQYGYKEMVQEVTKLRTQNPSTPVFITREYGRPAMYYWFYSKTNPAVVQQEEATAIKDQAEFLTFENISFINSTNEAKAGIIASSPTGFILLQNAFSSVKVLSEVKDLRGQTVWVISQVE